MMRLNLDMAVGCAPRLSATSNSYGGFRVLGYGAF